MNLLIKNCVAFIVLTLLVLVQNVKAIYVVEKEFNNTSRKHWYENEVWVINTLSSGQNLELHCQSKDNDLGVQQLSPTYYFEFKFKVNFWGTTQFYCSFKFDNLVHWFDVFKASRDSNL